jgi:hypothetical protein
MKQPIYDARNHIYAIINQTNVNVNYDLSFVQTCARILDILDSGTTTILNKQEAINEFLELIRYRKTIGWGEREPQDDRNSGNRPGGSSGPRSGPRSNNDDDDNDDNNKPKPPKPRKFVPINTQYNDKLIDY